LTRRFFDDNIVKRKSIRKSGTTVSTDLADKRCSSGVEGLDDILAGGLPRDCFYLVQGDPGSGKTTLALQFLLEGLRRGEKVFYITLSETKQELLKVARSHGWSLDKIPVLDLSAVENLLRPEAQTTVFHPSEVELAKVSQLLLDEVRKAQPARVAFDSLSEFRLMAETALRYRRQLLTLKQQFAKFKSTVLLLDDKMDKRGVIDPHVLSLTHGVIDMEQLSPDYGTSRRRLRVSKLRAVKFREGYHDYIIATGGLRIFPRMIAAAALSGTSPFPAASRSWIPCAVVGWIEGRPPSYSARWALANLL
jgi:circadian clock protein KaiC